LISPEKVAATRESLFKKYFAEFLPLTPPFAYVEEYHSNSTGKLSSGYELRLGVVTNRAALN
jgi:hypothetical protein